MADHDKIKADAAKAFSELSTHDKVRMTAHIENHTNGGRGFNFPDCPIAVKLREGCDPLPINDGMKIRYNQYGLYLDFAPGADHVVHNGIFTFYFSEDRYLTNLRLSGENIPDALIRHWNNPARYGEPNTLVATYDKSVDAFYLYLMPREEWPEERNAAKYGECVSDSGLKVVSTIVVDKTIEGNQILGIEILGFSAAVNKEDEEGGDAPLSIST
jgi:hypothetical protein